MTKLDHEKFVDCWLYLHCPECKEPIQTPKQIRCNNCKILFDWEDED